MTAVIRTGGKQYSVNKDDIIIVEKLPEEQGKTITFSDVLMITEGEKTLVGTPYIENASVTAQIIEQSRSKKIIVFKKKRRQNYRRTMGHRQLQTKLKIIDIATSSSKKVVKKVQKTKGLKKKIIKKEIITKEKKNKEILDSKNDNTKASRSFEQKPEIKKIKTQPSEKKEYKIKDYVVYPKHGVGQITELKKINIGGIDVETYILRFEKDKASGMVPINKQSHLRPLATINQVNKCISILKSKPKIKRSMWSRRAQEYEAKISSGKIYELAEVVRDLNKGDDLMIDQSYSERLLFEKAYERMLTEFQIILGLSTQDAQKKLDKALKRNLETQSPKPAQKIEATPDGTVEESNI